MAYNNNLLFSLIILQADGTHLGAFISWGFSDSYSQMVGGSGIRCWFSWAGHQEWLAHAAGSQCWVGGARGSAGPVNQDTWMWSLHMVILFPVRWLVSKEIPKRKEPVSKHQEAQEEATASYNPTSEVLECQFLLLLVERVIKAQPGFTGRELESTSWHEGQQVHTGREEINNGHPWILLQKEINIGNKHRQKRSITHWPLIPHCCCC